jgi:hypothetical protein
VIDRIHHTGGGMNAASIAQALRRFERAAGGVGQAAEPTAEAAPSPKGRPAAAAPAQELAPAMVELISAKYAMQASLKVAAATNESVSDVVKVLGQGL